MKLKLLCKILLALILIAVLALGVVVIVKGTNGMQNSFKLHYLDVNGSKVFDNTSELGVSPGKNYVIKVQNTFGTIQGDKIKISDVTVSANENVSFDYYVGGELKSWNNEPYDFTSWFITFAKDGFILRTPTTSLQAFLQVFHGSSEITLPDEFGQDIYPFTLTVTADKTSYAVNFRIPVYEPEIVDIEPNEVIF